MPKLNKKLVGPFVVQVEVNLGWQNQTVESVYEAKEIGSRTIAKWQSEGLMRLRNGANLFTDENFSTTKVLRIFNAKDKLVTNEVLAF